MYNVEQQKNLTSLTSELLKSDVQTQQLQDLRQVLRYHDWRYYVLSEPQITDFDYDLLFKKLKDIEKKYPHLVAPDSPTQRISGNLTESFAPVTHLTPMLSLENTYNAQDLKETDERIHEYTQQSEIEYGVEPKFDGSSIALVYENDLLIRAATRGDGQVGEEITANAKAISSIPLSAPFSKFGIKKIEIRGEVLIEKEVFKKLNEKRISMGEKTFQNARNTASGSLRLKDPSEVVQRKLEAILYHISYAEKTDGSDYLNQAGITHVGNIELLHACGFKTPLNEIKVCRGMEEVDLFLKLWDEKRQTFKYETDGMVIKVNSLKQQKQCGSTAHHPRWAVAYKFAANQAHSKLLDVEYQVGRTGAITPVAKIEPVALSGVTISSISLHNEDFIVERDIHLYDTVIVERAGEVIPYIVGVVPSLRNGNEKPISFISRCPSCNTALIRPEDEAVWRCENIECPAQTNERIIHFVSKDCMDIEGLGRSIVTDFMERGFIKTVADIYELPYSEIQKLEGWGERSISNLKDGIELSKNKPLWRLLNALGIRLVGVGTAKDISSHVDTIFDLTSKTVEELKNIEGIGPKVAQSIRDYFQNPGNIHLLNRLKEFGLNLENRAEDALARNNKLEGKTFLFTGSLQQFTRDRAKQLVEENGGKLLSSVSANLNFLVVGEDAGSKLTKAQKIESIKILTEDEFLKMIE